MKEKKDKATESAVAHVPELNDNSQQAKVAPVKKTQQSDILTETPAPAFVCQDGCMGELVINPVTRQLEFAVFFPDSTVLKRLRTVPDGPIVYKTPMGAGKICTTGFGTRSGAVLLPTEPLDYGNEEQLITEIQGFIHTYVELPQDYELIAAHYVMFTWVFDRFDEVPYLRFFTHDIGCGKSRALETIGSICYRPIFLGGSSSCASLRRIIDQYRGTIVADEQDRSGSHDLTADYTKIFNQGFQRGRPVILCRVSGDEPVPQKFDVFGPKLVVTRTKFDDDALESRFFTILMRQRTRSDLPLNLPRKEFDERALGLRNKLLQYRFDYYHKITIDPSLMVSGIADRLNQIGIPLLSTVTSDKARFQIVAHLKDIQQNLAEHYADSDAGGIVRYLDDQWSDPHKDVLVGDVATHLNVLFTDGNLIGLGSYDKSITPRKVGEIIRNQLGLKTKHTRLGNIIIRDDQRFKALKGKYGSGGESSQHSSPKPSQP